MPMPSQVAVQIPKFFNEINQLVLNPHPEPSLLTQFKKDAEKYIQSDNVEAYLALGTLAGLEGNLEALQANYQQAITEYSAKHAYILMLYAKCLTPYGFFLQVADFHHQAYCLSPILDYLDEAIYFYGLAGHFHQVVSKLQTWNQVNPQVAHRFSQLAGKVVKLMDERNVSDADLERLINVVLSQLRQHKLSIAASQFNISLLEDEDSQWFHYGIPLHESVEKMVALDFELADRIAEEKLPVNLTGYFVPTFEMVGAD
jgi:tetratricopeptide (TPR) repeat protein